MPIQTNTSVSHHTPGPWRTVTPDDSPCTDVMAGPITVAAVYWGHGYVEGQQFPAIEEAEANARLIAAAPDLYHALQEFIDDEPCQLDHEGYCQTHYITNPCIVVEAKNAIAKAEGREP